MWTLILTLITYEGTAMVTVYDIKDRATCYRAGATWRKSLPTDVRTASSVCLETLAP